MRRPGLGRGGRVSHVSLLRGRGQLSLQRGRVYKRGGAVPRVSMRGTRNRGGMAYETRGGVSQRPSNATWGSALESESPVSYEAMPHPRMLHNRTGTIDGLDNDNNDEVNDYNIHDTINDQEEPMNQPDVAVSSRTSEKPSSQSADLPAPVPSVALKQERSALLTGPSMMSTTFSNPGLTMGLRPMTTSSMSLNPLLHNIAALNQLQRPELRPTLPRPALLTSMSTNPLNAVSTARLVTTTRPTTTTGGTREKRFIKLECPHCLVKIRTFAAYNAHLGSSDHVDQMQTLFHRISKLISGVKYWQRRHSNAAFNESMRLKRERNTLVTTKRVLCSVCDLIHYNSKLDHEQTEEHKLLCKTRKTRCEVCNEDFRSAMDYMHHVASIDHQKVRSQMGLDSVNECLALVTDLSKYVQRKTKEAKNETKTTSSTITSTGIVTDSKTRTATTLPSLMAIPTVKPSTVTNPTAKTTAAKMTSEEPVKSTTTTLDNKKNEIGITDDPSPSSSKHKDETLATASAQTSSSSQIEISEEKDKSPTNTDADSALSKGNKESDQGLESLGIGKKTDHEGHDATLVVENQIEQPDPSKEEESKYVEDQTNIGEEYLRWVRVMHCSLCNEYLSDNSQDESALLRDHCSSSRHIEAFNREEERLRTEAALTNSSREDRIRSWERMDDDVEDEDDDVLLLTDNTNSLI